MFEESLRTFKEVHSNNTADITNIAYLNYIVCMESIFTQLCRSKCLQILEYDPIFMVCFIWLWAFFCVVHLESTKSYKKTGGFCVLVYGVEKYGVHF